LMKRAEAFAAGEPHPVEAAPAEPAPEQAVPEAPDAGMDPVLAEIFVKEMRTHLAAIREYLDACRAAGGPRPVEEPQYRACHTLLGSARMAAYEPAMALAAPLSEHMREHFEAGNGLDDDALAALERAAGEIEEMARALERGTPYVLPDGLVEGLAALAPRPTEPAAEPEAAAAAPDEPPVAQFDPEIAAIFTEEAAEILDSAEQALQSIREGGDHGAIVELQRFLHTLKGGARMAGVAAMGDLSHALETLLADMASGRVAPDDAAVELDQLTPEEMQRMRDTLNAGRAVADAADLRRRVESSHRGVEADGAVAEPAAPPPAAEPLPPSAPELEVEVAADDRRPDDAVAPLELLEPAGDAEPAGAPAPAETLPEAISEQM